jgi:hypothetical protein
MQHAPYGQGGVAGLMQQHMGFPAMQPGLAAAAAHMVPGQPAAAAVGGQAPVAPGGLQGGGEVMFNGVIIEGLDDL